MIDNEGFRIPRRFLARDAVDGEIERLAQAIESSATEITNNRDSVDRQLGSQYGAIFEAHLQMLRDPRLRSELEELIRQRQYSAEYAVSRALRRYAKVFEALESSYLADRTNDIADIEKLLLRNLLGKRREVLAHLTSPVLVLAHNLTPSETANLDRRFVRGFVTELGGPGSHTAIVAGALEIPAVVGMGPFLTDVSGGELVIIDDGQTDDLADYVAGLGDERIRMVRLASTDKTLGELRNAAVANARGDLVCQWDDDDLSDPDRLWWQVGVLNDSGAEACFLERWTILWSDGPRIAIGTRRLWEGSMVARREVVVEYPALRRGEDSPVAEAIVSRGTVALLDLPELYIYLVHGNNTFDAAHFDAHWDAATLRVEDPNAYLAHLQNRVPVAQALAAVAGMTS